MSLVAGFYEKTQIDNRKRASAGSAARPRRRQLAGASPSCDPPTSTSGAAAPELVSRAARQRRSLIKGEKDGRGKESTPASFLAGPGIGGRLSKALVCLAPAAIVFEAASGNAAERPRKAPLKNSFLIPTFTPCG